MIVIVSDLHLQHTKHDVVRRREGERVLETRVARNVSARALGLLFSEILENAERCHAKQVHLVFAGDLFELHRTPLWFLWNDGVRPVQSPPGEELEAKVLDILDHIANDNAEFFAALQRFVTSGTFVHRGEQQQLSSAEIKVHYIPGNHDRLVQCWPSTRARVRRLLALPGDGTLPFPHALEWDRSLGYGVRIRHGHEYDRFNFSADVGPEMLPHPEAYAKPALGDYVTVDIVTRLAVAFRAHFARELRLPGEAGERFRRVYAALTELDDVRPQHRLPRYLAHALEALKGDAFSMLRPVLKDVFETARFDSFFVSELERVGFGPSALGSLAERLALALEGPDETAWLAALEELEPIWEARLPKHGPSSLARFEPGLESGALSLIVAGHTHEADHVALSVTSPGGQPKEAYFLDTGTWRTRIDAREGRAFGRLRSCTMVFFYHDSELRSDELRRFETWIGHLCAQDYGPELSVDVTGSTPQAPRQEVRLLDVTVQHVDEGETEDGAELRLHFGVDGAGLTATFQGVHDGDVLALPDDSVLEVDPALDGEVWCFGVEEDLGPGSLLEREDLIPWAVTFLKRENRDAGAPFLPQTFILRASDNRGNAFSLRFQVAPTPPAAS